MVHNHDLLSIEEVHFLTAYRNIIIEDEKCILLLKEGGLSVKKNYACDETREKCKTRGTSFS